MRLIARLAAPCLTGMVLAALAPLPAKAQQCGGGFQQFVAALADEAVARGHDRQAVNGFLAGVRKDQSVLNADRRQGVFQMPFVDFARRLISANRLNRGQELSRRHDAVFDRIERDYGIDRGVLLAFWAFETDYGAVQGDFNTRDALVTLAHDCRRPHLFRPQIFAAMTLYERGDFSPQRTKGAWAGEIGMVQMLPEDILEHGTDGDGDGHVDLKRSPQDALLSGASMLAGLGWRAHEPWLQEVTLPEGMDWAETGLRTKKPARDWQTMGVRPRHGEIAGDLPASILVPQGRGGPAFLAYPNFRVYFEWNQSFVYVLTAAYFANRLEGAPVFDAGQPEPGLSGEEMKALQRKLAARGHDVGGIDGILGAGTREAVQEVQQELGLPADAWPTRALLDRL